VLEDDPLWYFFIGLSLMESIQDILLALTEPSEISNLLQNVRITSSENSVNLCSQAKNLKWRTPLSFRDQALATNRAKNFDGRVLDHLKTDLCLKVSITEVLQYQTARLEESTGPINFFILDCRPTEQYLSGRLPNAKHLNPSSITENAQDFSLALETFKSPEPNAHYCFVGSGSPDEDLSLNLIVSRFLHSRFKYISILEGGYQACHAMFTEDDMTFLLCDHNPQQCQVCQKKGSSKSAIGNKISSLGSMIRTRSTSVKEKFQKLPSWKDLKGKRSSIEIKQEDSKHPQPAPKEPEKQITKPSNKASRSSSLDQASVFTIGDEEETFASPPVELKERKPSVSIELAWNSLDDWKKDTNLIVEAKELETDSSPTPGYLVINNSLIVWLLVQDEKDKKAPKVRMDHSHPLVDLQKITYKKKTPNILIFQFPNTSYQYHVDNPNEVIRSVNQKVTANQN